MSGIHLNLGNVLQSVLAPVKNILQGTVAAVKPITASVGLPLTATVAGVAGIGAAVKGSLDGLKNDLKGSAAANAAHASTSAAAGGSASSAGGSSGSAGSTGSTTGTSADGIPSAGGANDDLKAIFAQAIKDSKDTLIISTAGNSTLAALKSKPNV